MKSALSAERACGALGLDVYVFPRYSQTSFPVNPVAPA